MLHFRKINPMARAIGTMGAVAALVGGITFAQLTSNTVVLANNTLAVQSAHLMLGLTNNGTCSDATNGPQTGMNFTKLVPGTTSSDFKFCLKNTGNVPLDVTAMIPTDLSSSTVPADKVTLNIKCGTNATATGTLSDFASNQTVATGLAAGAEVDCQANAKIDSTVTSSGATVTPFDIDFMGTQVAV